MEPTRNPASGRDDYYDLGAYGRPVNTGSAEAQAWFDRGLNWCYGFNHEEAIRCFERAAAADPACAMAHWGVSYAAGCNYNKPWEAFLEEERREALSQAYAAVARAEAAVEAAGADAWPVEAALVRALRQRYPAPTADAGAAPWLTWNDAYAAAMREVRAAFPDDHDVAALFAEALINRTPWQLWDLPSGEPAAGADTLEAQAVLERAIAEREAAGAAPHPGLLHVYLHTMEMSPRPEAALRAADALRDLVPDAGHLRHMASHIDVLCGHYHAALVANERAIAADDRYFAREAGATFYALYRCHDIHFKLYSALFLGQLEPALEAARQLEDALPEALLRTPVPPMADWLEGFLSMRVHALIRFGRWHDVLALPLPADPELYCVTTAMTRYARGVAQAALSDVAAARAEQRAFEAARARVPESRTLFNNTCLAILEVAAQMLEGEVAYRAGEHERAFAALREAVALSDGLTYDEPWAWMQPVRHALGALLLEQGRVEEAAPFRQRLALAQARADVPIASSCFCRLEGPHAGQHHHLAHDHPHHHHGP